MDLAERLLKGDKRTLARLITLIENNDPQAIEVLKRIYYHTGKAHVIGVTGPPGAGKSTLTDKLAKEFSKGGKKIAIIAVDPTSPFTGGAILGDRVRMSDLTNNPNVFIRSMGSRGNLGGLSKNTLGVIKAFDAYGMDYIFVETVGVGQSEVDIVKAVDTTILVMVPGLGDDIQAIKAGIMEIGNIFVVNKADLEGASRTMMELETMLDFRQDEGWKPRVREGVGRDKIGSKKIGDSIDDHMDYLQKSDKLDNARKENIKKEIIEIAKSNMVVHIFNNQDKDNQIELVAEKVSNKENDPYTASDEILRSFIDRGVNND